MVVVTIRLYESEDQAENDNDASRCVGIEILTIHQNSAKRFGQLFYVLGKDVKGEEHI